MQRGDERDSEVDVEALLDEEASDANGSRSVDQGLRGRVGERLRPDFPRVFSPRGFLIALALVVGGWLAGGFALGSLGGLLGAAAAGFTLGIVGRRRYSELALAGGVAAGVSATFNHLVLAVLTGFAAPAVLGAGSGALAAVVGHYLGRDLLDGLTRDL